MPRDAEDLVTDYDAQDILSLNLQRLVQLCVDLGAHVISSRAWRAPSTMAETFTVLSQVNVIDESLADRMRRAVGFRNVSVHEYQSIDWNHVYRLVTTRLDDFRIFTQQVIAALDDTR